jgi:hypothetical protein
MRNSRREIDAEGLEKHCEIVSVSVGALKMW